MAGWPTSASNRAHAHAETSAFGRHIEVRLLQAEVPLHYLLNFRHSRFPAAVELGVQAVRRWCRDRQLLPA